MRVIATVKYEKNGKLETERFVLVSRYPEGTVESVEYYWCSVSCDILWVRSFRTIEEARSEMFNTYNNIDMKSFSIEVENEY